MNGSPSLTDLLFSFEGRIGRQTFWMKFVLPVIIVAVIVAGLDYLIGAGGILSGVFQLAILWPSLAVYCKRWHDRDKSGWWTLIVLIPLIGSIWILVECGFLQGTAGSNRFGEDPVPA